MCVTVASCGPIREWYRRYIPYKTASQLCWWWIWVIWVPSLMYHGREHSSSEIYNPLTKPHVSRHQHWKYVRTEENCWKELRAELINKNHHHFCAFLPADGCKYWRKWSLGHFHLRHKRKVATTQYPPLIYLGWGSGPSVLRNFNFLGIDGIPGFLGTRSF